MLNFAHLNCDKVTQLFDTSLFYSAFVAIFVDRYDKNRCTMKKELNICYEHYESKEAMPEADRTLVEEAIKATERAYAQYSKFNVGAAARLRSGRIISAANSESEVFPSGLCAERSLLFYYQTNFADDPIEALAIASNPSERECYPCGNCRQTIVDVEHRQGSPMRIIMWGNGTASVIDSAEKLLPFTFKL